MQLCCNTQVADDDQEYAGTITSSPVPQPQATIPICSAAVPEFVVMACLLPFHSANSFSKAVQLGPKAWLPPLSESSTIVRSLSSIGGHFLTVPSGIDLRPPLIASRVAVVVMGEAPMHR